jgi:hypothetical protein
MALSISEKALAILLGIETARPGTTGKATRAAIRAGAKAIIAGGRLAAPVAPPLARGALAAGGLGLRGAAALARLHPVGALAATGLAAHQLGYLDPAYEMLERERQMAAQQYAIAAPTILPELERTYIAPVKRRVSKANRAVKAGMAMLKAGTKRTTGAVPGKLPKGAFAIATKAAGLAHPGTPSSIRIGKSVTNLLARKLKKWWK